MNPVEEGVSNFRGFQAEMRDFRSEWKGAEIERNKRQDRSSRRQGWVSIVLGAALAIATIFEVMHMYGCAGRPDYYAPVQTTQRPG